MEIRKGFEAEGKGCPTAAQLETINVQAKSDMKPEQVYVFSLRLCDDQVDRDGERSARPVLWITNGAVTIRSPGSSRRKW